MVDWEAADCTALVCCNSTLVSSVGAQSGVRAGIHCTLLWCRNRGDCAPSMNTEDTAWQLGRQRCPSRRAGRRLLDWLRKPAVGSRHKP